MMIPRGFAVSESASIYNRTEKSFLIDCFRIDDPRRAIVVIKVYPTTQAGGVAVFDLAEREGLVFLKAKGPFVVNLLDKVCYTELSACLVFGKWGRGVRDLARKSSVSKLKLQREVFEIENKCFSHACISSYLGLAE